MTTDAARGPLTAPDEAGRGYWISPAQEHEISRLEALLVDRSGTEDWWAALAARVDRVLDSVRVPRGAHDALPADTRRLARLDHEHDALLAELEELRSGVRTHGRERLDVARAIAAATEVIALLRAFQRRSRELARDARLELAPAAAVPS